MSARARMPALLASLALLIVGCGGPAASQTSADTRPRTGGTLKLSISAEPGCLDAQAISATQQALLGRILYDTLTTIDPDGNLAPYLAESWKISPDGKEYVFKLRRGVTFSDGAVWNAEALKANFEHMRDPKTKSPLAAAYIAPYVGSEVVDEYTLKVKLAYAYTPFLYNLAQSWLALLSPKAIKESPETLCDKPIASGPFVLERYQRQQSITYVRRPDYNWAPAWLKHQGPAYLDRIEITVVAEPVVRFNSLASGQYDITEAAPPQNAEAIKKNPNLVYENLIRTGNPWVLMFNLSRTPFDDLRVRQAFVAAVNAPAITKSLGFGTFTAKDNYLATPTKYYDKTTEGKLKYDPDRANQLLDAAGWTARDADGYRTKDGKRLVVEAPTVESATPSPQLVQIQGEVKKAGIDLQIQQVPQAQLTERRYDGDYDAIGGVWHTNTPDVLFIRFHSSEISGQRIGQNAAYLSDPALDKILRSAREKPDGPEAAKLYGQAQQRLIELVPGLPLYENSSQWAYSKKVKDIRVDTSHPIPVFTTAWIGG
ncbi:ABC transporter substrate-binding protein [Kribbella sp. NPDC056951]|uniref:ABC transporter substrate-binding protein n=1 Tax=Kribbella sp. NPDC056951 TaxID=3345978 RepID=UPI0036334CA2